VAGSRSYVLRPGQFLQHGRFLADFGVARLEGGTLRVRLAYSAELGVNGGVVTLVTEVDGNTVAGSNDSYVVPATLVVRAPR
jgi:hypothetical protein